MLLLPAFINIENQNATCLSSWMTTLPRPFADESHTRSEVRYPGLCTLHEPSLPLQSWYRKLLLLLLLLLWHCMLLLPLQTVFALKHCRFAEPFGITEGHCHLALQVVTDLWHCRLSSPVGVAYCTSVLSRSDVPVAKLSKRRLRENLRSRHHNGHLGAARLLSASSYQA